MLAAVFVFIVYISSTNAIKLNTNLRPRQRPAVEQSSTPASDFYTFETATVLEPKLFSVKPLVDAVDSNNLRDLQDLLASGVSRQATDIYAATDLAFANYNFEAITLLLRYGLGPSEETLYDWIERPTHTLGLSRKLLVQPSPRERAPPVTVEALQKILRDFLSRGPEAFEESIGSVMLDGGSDATDTPSRYIDLKTGEVLPHTPVSCAWLRTRGSEGEPAYLNTITGQVVYVRPKALAWVVRRTEEGTLYWFNYRTGTVQLRMVPRPAELSPRFAEELRERAGRRFYNEATGEETDEDFRELVFRKVEGSDGATWYFKGATNERLRTRPKDLPDLSQWKERPFDAPLPSAGA